MKGVKLISSTEYIRIQEKLYKSGEITATVFANRVIRYKNFLIVSLEVKRFVACDKRTGIPFPEFKYCCGGGMQDQCGCMGMPINVHPKELEDYHEALKDVWFVNISAQQVEYFVTAQCSTIENTIGKYHLYLTFSKAKDLGLKSKD